ncbi:MAG: response regulator transcription factor [Burkholderiales bacterium]|nr:LytTR family DNA-binding domain-containing protein [Burkholderiales bacterium]MDE1926197.1 response regulator transcription factor [Burkholderiales bacterium]MDE2158748.1 response regulator transcription factor [Burkholderiales bacterium]MDE2504663.1 response regulator transcription factor [Burkholderiales bacterium]
MKLLIVDDEPLARLRLRSLIEAVAASLPELEAEVAGEAADADAALLALREAPVDALLLDIAMPGRDGLKLAAALRRLPQVPAVVFVSAHAEHALRAFDLDAVDYLTKPVRRERLAAALQRVQQRITGIVPTQPAPLAEPPMLVVSDRGRVLRLPIDELLYFKAELKYVTLRTTTRTLLLDDTLAELEPRLEGLGGDFIRVHRNALVAKRAIRALEQRKGGDSGDGEGWAVRVSPIDEWLAVSRRQVQAVRAALRAVG